MFITNDDENFKKGEPIGNNEFKLESEWVEGEMTCFFYEEDEPDAYFGNFKLLHQEKRIIADSYFENGHRIGYIDYIGVKNNLCF